MLDRKQARRVLHAALAARACDTVERELIAQGKGALLVGGSGAETGALASLFLKQGDSLFLHWRDRALRLASGISVQQCAASFFAIQDARGSDRNLTCHESSKENRVFPLATPTASQCLPACGVAWGKKLANEKSAVTLCSVGDGSTRQGEFFESIAFALEKQLQVLFVVVDNGFAISTRTAGKKSSDLGMLSPSLQLNADAWEPEQLIGHYRAAIAHVRKNQQPLLLNIRSPRLGSHTSNDDHTGYKSEQELVVDQRRDPLHHLKRWLIEQDILDRTEVIDLERSAVSFVQATYKDVESTPSPRSNEQHADVLEVTTESGRMRPDLRAITRNREAVNHALERLLERRALLFGQDIEDPLGGVFRLTSGLSTKFPSQVFNSPLAEATIVGVANGISLDGRIAVAEIQFIDFLAPGWNQLTTNITPLHWRTNGDWTSPVILYAPVDGYSPGEGLWHSQISASILARQAGLTVVMPSNPVDTFDAFSHAADSGNPTFILLPKSLLWKRFSPETLDGLGRLGGTSARRLFAGDRLTVATWGMGIALVERALQAYPPGTIELIDMRYLQPLDIETVSKSAERTGALLVVDPEHDGASLGNYLALEASRSIVSTKAKVLHRKYQHLGTSEDSEKQTLIQVEDIVGAFKVLGVEPPK